MNANLFFSVLNRFLAASMMSAILISAFLVLPLTGLFEGAPWPLMWMQTAVSVFPIIAGGLFAISVILTIPSAKALTPVFRASGFHPAPSVKSVDIPPAAPTSKFPVTHEMLGRIDAVEAGLLEIYYPVLITNRLLREKKGVYFIHCPECSRPRSAFYQAGDISVLCQSLECGKETKLMDIVQALAKVNPKVIDRIIARSARLDAA